MLPGFTADAALSPRSQQYEMVGGFEAATAGATVVPQFARGVIEAFGWRAAYAALGVLTFAVAFPAVALFIREPEAPQDSSHVGRTLSGSPGLSVHESVRSSAFWLIAVSVLLVVTTINGIVGHLVPMLTDRGLNVGQATATLSAVGLSTIAGRLAAGYFLDRFFAPYVAAGLFLLPLVAISARDPGAGRVG